MLQNAQTNRHSTRQDIDGLLLRTCRKGAFQILFRLLCGNQHNSHRWRNRLAPLCRAAVLVCGKGYSAYRQPLTSPCSPPPVTASPISLPSFLFVQPVSTSVPPVQAPRGLMTCLCNGKYGAATFAKSIALALL